MIKSRQTNNAKRIRRRLANAEIPIKGKHATASSATSNMPYPEIPGFTRVELSAATTHRAFYPYSIILTPHIASEIAPDHATFDVRRVAP